MQWADGLVVATVEDYKGVVVRLQDIQVLRSRWVELWAKAKANTYAAWKGVVAEEKKGTDICDRAVSVAKSKALIWKQNQDRIIAEEQRKLQAEADLKARKEKERLEKEAEKLKTPEKKEERLQAAAEVVAPVVTVASPVANVKGVGSRKVWKGEVTDMAALIAAATPGSVAASFLEVNQKRVDGFARSTKNTVKVPGVDFVEIEGLTIRGGE
ncbi:MAG: hypothetical protein DDT33_01737 [Firmicutes bacterium]|nr:hypothetical protein [Bacillota bacterium]